MKKSKIQKASIPGHLYKRCSYGGKWLSGRGRIHRKKSFIYYQHRMMRLYEYLKQNGYNVQLTNNNSINNLCKNILLISNQEDGDFIDPLYINYFPIKNLSELINTKSIINMRNSLSSYNEVLFKLIIGRFITEKIDIYTYNISLANHLSYILGEYSYSGSYMTKLGLSEFTKGKGVGEQMEVNIIKTLENLILSAFRYELKDIICYEQDGSLKIDQEILSSVISSNGIGKNIISLLGFLCKGINKDKISDMTCNVISKDLYNYTIGFLNSINFNYTNENTIQEGILIYRNDKKKLWNKANLAITKFNDKKPILLTPWILIDHKIKLSKIDCDYSIKYNVRVNGKLYYRDKMEIYTEECFKKIYSRLNSQINNIYV